MYDEFKKDKKLWDLGNERELALIREESLKMEYEDRVKKGIELAKKEALKKDRELCIKLLKKRYQIDNRQWVIKLNEDQLKMLLENIYDGDEFKDLKQRVDELCGNGKKFD